MNLILLLVEFKHAGNTVAASGGGTLKTVILEVCSPEDAFEDFARTWETGKSHKSARIGFATPELLWKVLTAKRWELLKALCGAGPVSIRQAARLIGKEIKTVQGDIKALLKAGILDHAPKGKIEFPYDAVKIEFMLKAA